MQNITQKLTPLFFLLLLSQFSIAQHIVSVKGSVLSGNEAVEFVEVKLLDMQLLIQRGNFLLTMLVQESILSNFVCLAIKQCLKD
jgi:hypothetical protein